MVSMSLLSRATGWISSATAYPRGTPAVASNAAPMERKALAEGETAVIILVGTTGSGKSTFANMLVDPAQDENLQVEHFRTSERIGQMTREITRVNQKIEMFDSDTQVSVGFASGYRARFEEHPLILHVSSEGRHKITDFRVTLPAKHKEDKYRTDLQDHDLTVTIHPDSGYFGTTQAEATVFSTKRIVNAAALTILRENVAVFEQQRVAAEVACDNIRASSEAARQAFSDALKAEIEDIQAEQARLLEEYIDVQEEFARNYADVN